MTMIEDRVGTQERMPETRYERRTTLYAIRRYWYVVVVCAVLAAGAGAVYAYKRPPVYTASSRLAAFSVSNSNAASLAGSLQAAEGLTSTFARVVQSSEVIQPVAAALNTTPAWVAQHLSGTPIPDSPVVRIDANASTPEVATKAANVALKSLTSYAQNLLATSSNLPSIEATIGADSIKLSRAETRLSHLKSQAGSQASQASQTLGATTTSSPSPGLQNQIDAANAKVTEDQTRLSGDQAAYSDIAAQQASGRTAVTQTQATTATSDRKQVAEIAILLGLVIGALIGGAAALGLAARAPRTS
jgi:capsular polysaccharide biosynthesis protein